MPGVTSSDAPLMSAQFAEVIEDELKKLHFRSLCEKIASKVVDRVSEIEKEHESIKTFYSQLGEQINNLQDDSDYSPIQPFLPPFHLQGTQDHAPPYNLHHLPTPPGFSPVSDFPPLPYLSPPPFLHSPPGGFPRSGVGGNKLGWMQLPPMMMGNIPVYSPNHVLPPACRSNVDSSSVRRTDYSSARDTNVTCDANAESIATTSPTDRHLPADSSEFDSQVDPSLEPILSVDPSEPILVDDPSESVLPVDSLQSGLPVSLSKDIQHVGLSAKDIIDHVSLSAKDIIDHVGLSAKDIEHVGLSAKDIQQVGLSAKDIIDHVGLSAKDIIDHVGLSAKDIEQVGLSAKDIDHVGLSAKDIQHVGLSAKDIQQVGLSAKDIQHVGLSAKDIIDHVGLSAKDIIDHVGLSAKDIEHVGLSGKDIQQVGLSAKDIQHVGLSAKDIQHVSLSEVDEPRSSELQYTKGITGEPMQSLDLELPGEELNFDSTESENDHCDPLSLSPNTVTSEAVSSIDISEPVDVSASSSFVDVESNSVDLNNTGTDEEEQVSLNEPLTPELKEKKERRSRLVLKLKAVPEKRKSTEVSSYSSTLVSKSESESSEKSSLQSLSPSPTKCKRKGFEFKAGAIVYAKPKLKESDIWYEAELLQEVTTKGKKLPKLQIRFMGGENLKETTHLSHIATKDPVSADMIEIGTRVVAGRPSDTVNSTVSNAYQDINSWGSINVMFAGVVAELACIANRHRYLVFFDDGYAQYFTPANLFLVVQPSRWVWKDVPNQYCQSFLKRYLTEYPYRKLVCTTVGTSMQTEWNGQLWKSRIESIDGSLMKVLFHADQRSEWLYRGTERLEPLFRHVHPHLFPKKKNEKKKKKENDDPTYIDETITHPQFGASKFSATDPYGEKQREAWDDPPHNAMFRPRAKSKAKQRGRKRKIEPNPEPAKKDNGMECEISVQDTLSVIDVLQSSAKVLSSPEPFPPDKGENPPDERENPPDKREIPRDKREIPPNKSDNPHDKREDPPPPLQSSMHSKPRGPHKCGVTCVEEYKKHSRSKYVGSINYLTIPFKFGWSRERMKRKLRFRDTYYRTPCNKRLRNIEEVSRYLTITKCKNVAIDMFSFNSDLSCKSEPPVNSKTPIAKIDDISAGKEASPIMCINEVNDELPNPIVYVNGRLPAEDVLINTDPGFLHCCDCTDNCQDIMKCGCLQLTVEASEVVNGIRDGNACYQYRRLKNNVTTGIYECNQNCSCSKQRCYNRVVQNGIQLRLQVFFTETRGWGVRCVDDIPKGTFVCTYAGQVLNEQTANKEGMDYGDEYLAELDHIEMVQKEKDDYESDVPELRGDRSKLTESSDNSDTDSTFSVLSVASSSVHEEGNGTASSSPKSILLSQEDENLFTSLQNIPKDATKPLLSVTIDVAPQSFAGDDSAEPVEQLVSVSTTGEQILLPPGKAFARKSTGNRARKLRQPLKELLNRKSGAMSTRNLYDGDQQMYVIDAKCFGNAGRFLNHSCSPNLYVQNVLVDTHDLRFPWVAFFTQEFIPAYTELTWNYNYEIGSVPGKTLLCKCGAKNCKGRLL